MSEIDRLRERVEELEDVLGMTAEFPRSLFPKAKFKLRACDPMLGMLMARRVVPRQAAFDALFGLKPEKDQPDVRHVDVVIAYLRQGLKPFGIEIQTAWGVGWHMTDDMKEKLRRLIASEGSSLAEPLRQETDISVGLSK